MAKKENKTESVEREYVIPLRVQVKKVPRYKRANKAVKTIKEFLVRHMKVYDKDLSKIKLDKEVNEFVWARGIRKPPMKVKIRAKKEGEIVRVNLVEVPAKIKFKKLREEKRDKKALEVVEKKKSMMEKAKQAMKKSPEKEEENVEEKEKKAAVVEEGAKIEKAKAKEMKHTAKAKSPKQEKNERVDYNKSSRGH